MTDDQLSISDGKGDDHVLVMCPNHEVTLRGMLMMRGLQDCVPDPYDELERGMAFGVVAFMGPDVFAQHGGCPACVLEGTLERACDEVLMSRRKSN